MSDEEYSRVIHEFYQTYRPLQKRYNLRLHSHFEPDCKHFSKAKGGKPKDKKIRGLAWVALRWAAMVRPRLIMLITTRRMYTKYQLSFAWVGSKRLSEGIGDGKDRKTCSWHDVTIGNIRLCNDLLKDK